MINRQHNAEDRSHVKIPLQKHESANRSGKGLKGQINMFMFIVKYNVAISAGQHLKKNIAINHVVNRGQLCVQFN